MAEPPPAQPLPGRADVVVVGGGHNGLVAATLLARAGLSVVVCETSAVFGGPRAPKNPSVRRRRCASPPGRTCSA